MKLFSSIKKLNPEQRKKFNRNVAIYSAVGVAGGIALTYLLKGKLCPKCTIVSGIGGGLIGGAISGSMTLARLRKQTLRAVE